MAGFESLRKGNRGGPQIELISESKELKSPISPYNVHSYAEKRPDYVAPPDRNPSAWAQLGAALKQFNPLLDRMVADQNQEDKENYSAEGQKKWDENQKSWEEFVKEHPEYEGYNPHFEHAYKAAELRSKGQLYKAKAEEFYITNGLANETDPVRVQEAMRDFHQTQTQELIHSGQYDDKSIAENFSGITQQVDGAILQQYSQDRANEHIRLGVAGFSTEIATTLGTIFSGTPGITSPDVWETKRGEVAEHFQGLMAEMKEGGMLTSRINSTITDAIIDYAISEGEDGLGREVLSLLDSIKAGTGTIGGLPETKAKVAELQRRWDREAKHKRDDEMYAYERLRTMERHQAQDGINALVFQAHKDGTRLTEAQFFDAAGKRNPDIAMSSWQTYQGHLQNPIVWSPEKQTEFSKDRQLVRQGRMSVEQARETVGRYGTKAYELIQLAEAAAEGGDPLSKAVSAPGYRQAENVLKIGLGDVSSAQLEGASRALMDWMEPWVDDQVAKTGSYSQLEFNKEAYRKALELSRDPVFTQPPVDATVLRSQQEIEEPGTITDWTANTKKRMGADVEAVQASILKYLRAEPEEQERIAQSWRISPNLFVDFLQNQAHLYGVSYADIAFQYLMEQEMEKLHPAVRERSGWGRAKPKNKGE